MTLLSREKGSEPVRKPNTAKGSVNGLKVGDPHDAFEREADRVAHDVMSGGQKLGWSLSAMAGCGVQRKCSCGGSSDSGTCEECSKQDTLQRKATGISTPSVAPPVVHEVLNSSGRSLDKGTRDFFEPRFGHDFSKIRVHTDTRAAESARAVKALAYTVGKDIVFGQSQYAPDTASGRSLLAHELTHTIQQGAGTSDARLQRQADVETADEEQDVNEPHDGDTPVITSAAPQAEVEEMETGGGLEELGPLAENEPEEMKAGGKKAKEQPKEKTEEKPKEKKKEGKKAAPPPPKKISSIDVDLTSQKMTVHYDDGTKEGHNISSGKGKPGTADDPCKTQTEENCTPTGDFKIVSKGNKDTKNKHGDRMSWYVELGGDKVIDGRGIGIHDSQPVGGGAAMSHGCVRVGETAADDAFAKKINQGVDDKTTVHISGKAPTKAYGKPPAPKKAPAKPKEKK